MSIAGHKVLSLMSWCLLLNSALYYRPPKIDRDTAVHEPVLVDRFITGFESITLVHVTLHVTEVC